MALMHVPLRAQPADQGLTSARMFAAVYALFMGLALGVAMLAHTKGSGSFSLAAGLYLFGAAVMMVSPKLGLYLTVFLTLFADKASAPWYPFIKNVSSRESILYIDDSLLFNPLEGYLVLLLISVGVHVLFGRLSLRRPPFLAPLLTFYGFLIFGFFWGVGRGGDTTVALWEIRPFAVMLVIYLVATTLLTTRTELQVLIALVIGTVVLEAVRILAFTLDQRSASGSLIDHAGALHLNIIFLMAMAAWLFRDVNLPARYLLPLAMLIVAPVYIISERRSAVVALVFGMLVLFAVLLKRQPGRFWFVAPAMVLLGVLYLIVFWNAKGGIGFAAETIRSQIAPTSTTRSNASSDLYRKIENIDVLSTIRKRPLTGVGFGQKYDQPIPLPDISGFFVWWAYIPHNSVLYIWLRAGFFGLVAMFYWIGSVTQTALRAATAAKDATDAVVLTALAGLFPMYLIYTYVDLSWDSQTLLLLGVAMAIISGLTELQKTSVDDQAMAS